MNNKLILTDADGVLFDWVTGFNAWMHGKGFKRLPDTEFHYTIDKWYNLETEHAMELVQDYNSSAAIGFLPPYLDSVEYVNKLADLGYRFVCITAMGHDEYAIKLRMMNLQNVFGDVFDDLLVVDLLQSKKHLLERYDQSIWIEDKPSAAEDGRACGHRCYLFEHGHNGDVSTSHGITRVHKWAEIYQSIVLEEHGASFVPALET